MYNFAVLFVLLLALSASSPSTAKESGRVFRRSLPDEDRRGLMKNKGGKKGSSDEDDGCTFMLATSTGSMGTAEATVTSDSLTIQYSGALPNTLYTIWIDYRSRATGAMSADYPIQGGSVDLTNTGAGIGRGVSPCISTTDPVYEGMRVDLNGIITDDDGDATIEIDLNYDLLGAVGESPVTAASLSMAGDNRLGGSWLRMYETSVTGGASSQVLVDGIPQVVRATPAGITIVGHFLPFSQGHTPGVGGVDHFGGYNGDFPSECSV